MLQTIHLFLVAGIVLYNIKQMSHVMKYLQYTQSLMKSIPPYLALSSINIFAYSKKHKVYLQQHFSGTPSFNICKV